MLLQMGYLRGLYTPLKIPELPDKVMGADSFHKLRGVERNATARDDIWDYDPKARLCSTIVRLNLKASVMKMIVDSEMLYVEGPQVTYVRTPWRVSMTFISVMKG